MISNKFPLLGFTSLALMFGGCASSAPIQPIAHSSEICPGIGDAYAGSPIKPEMVIYSRSSSEPKRFPIDQLDDALNFYFSNKTQEQPLLLYVHGRALSGTHEGDYDHEPEESHKDVIPTFSSKYNIDTTIMLHWPHRKQNSGDDEGFPEGDAKSAGKALSCIIKRLDSPGFDKSRFPGFRALITHSMGALVLEDALSNSNEDLHGFDAVVIAAAASRSKTASSWLPKVAANKRYVLVNTHDAVLTGLKKKVGFVPLGKCDSDCFQANKPAPNMVYLDITDIAGMPLKARHNYFAKGDVTEVVAKILRGEEPPMGSQSAYENVRIIKDSDIARR